MSEERDSARPTELNGAGPPGSGAARNGADGTARLRLASEFGSVTVELDEHANGPRLRIEDLRNGRVIYLDPLELASLTWLTHDRLGPFLDPSQTGWRSDEGAWDDPDD